MNTKTAASPAIIGKLRELLSRAGTGARNMVQTAARNNPRAAESASSLVDDIYKSYEPKSRDILKNLVSDRLDAVRNSNFTQSLPKRFQGYVNNIGKGEAKYFGNKLDKGLQQFNQKAYNSIKSMLNPEQQIVHVKKGFEKKAIELGLSRLESEQLFAKVANAVNVSKVVGDYIKKHSPTSTALRYAGGVGLGGAGVGGALGALSADEGESKLDRALEGALSLGTAGLMSGGSYGYLKGLGKTLNNLNRVNQHGAEHIYEQDILKKTNPLKKKVSPTAQADKDKAARAARNAERKAKNMAGKPIDIASEKIGQHVSPSKLINDAYMKKKLMNSLFGGGVGGAIGGGIGALREPQEDESRLNNALIGAGIGGGAGAGIGYMTGGSRIKEILENIQDPYRYSSHKARATDKVREAIRREQEAIRREQGTKSWKETYKDVRDLYSAKPNEDQIADAVSEAVAQNAGKLKPDSIEDVLYNGYSKPDSKFVDKITMNTKETSPGKFEGIKDTMKTFKKKLDKSKAIEVSKDPTTGVYSAKD